MLGVQASPATAPISGSVTVAITTSIDTSTASADAADAAVAGAAEPSPTPSSIQERETRRGGGFNEKIDVSLVDELVRRTRCVDGPTPRRASVAAALKMVQAKDAKAALKAVPLGSRSRVKKTCDLVRCLLQQIERERQLSPVARVCRPYSAASQYGTAH